jgi:hypothetical protein
MNGLLHSEAPTNSSISRGSPCDSSFVFGEINVDHPTKEPFLTEVP